MSKFKGKIHLNYYLMFGLMLVNNYLSDMKLLQGLYVHIKPVILLSTIFFTIFIAIEKQYRIGEILIIVTLIIIGLYTYWQVGSSWPLYTLLLVALSRNVKIEKVVDVSYKYMSTFLVISLSIFVFQMLFFRSSVDVLINGDSVKYGMTFMAAGEAMRYWIFWVLLFIYRRFEKNLKVKEILLIITGTIFFYVCTEADAVILVPIILLLKYMRRYTRFIKFLTKISPLSFLVFGVFSFSLWLLKGSFIYYIVDIFCTGRISLGHNVFKMHGITLFGRTPIEFYKWILVGDSGGYRQVVDNFYYFLAIQYGIVYLAILSFVFILSRKKITYKEGICILTYSLYALSVNMLLSPTALYPVIIASALSWRVRNENNSGQM